MVIHPFARKGGCQKIHLRAPARKETAWPSVSLPVFIHPSLSPFLSLYVSLSLYHSLSSSLSVFSYFNVALIMRFPFSSFCVFLSRSLFLSSLFFLSFAFSFFLLTFLSQLSLYLCVKCFKLSGIGMYLGGYLINRQGKIRVADYFPNCARKCSNNTSLFLALSSSLSLSLSLSLSFSSSPCDLILMAFFLQTLFSNPCLRVYWLKSILI